MFTGDSTPYAGLELFVGFLSCAAPAVIPGRAFLRSVGKRESAVWSSFIQSGDAKWRTIWL